MKTFFKNSLYLAAFMASGVLFQISCSNSDDSTTRTLAAPGSTNKILFVKNDVSSGYYVRSLWTCDLDGSNQHEIPINLPANVVFHLYGSTDSQPNAKLSADGQKVIFSAWESGPAGVVSSSLYSCDLDGGNLQEIVHLSGNEQVQIEDIQ